MKISFRTDLIKGDKGEDGQSYDLPENTVIQYVGEGTPEGYEEISDLSNVKYIKKTGDTQLEAKGKVINSLTEATNQHKNTLSIRAIRELYANLYPIGAIYLSINQVNPATIYGGVWRQLKDVYLKASGAVNAGTTGGANKSPFTPAGTVQGHALTVNEMPEHTHVYLAPPSESDDTTLTQLQMPAHSHYISINDPYSGQVQIDSQGNTVMGIIGTTAKQWATETVGGSQPHNHSINSITDDTQATGDNRPHTHVFTGTRGEIDVMPPYITVNAWVRIA